jgi:microcystin-dependent protein
MADPFVGEIKMIGFSFPPPGWAFCDGKILDTQQHSALYSLLGNAFGGDGETNFALPDLQSRVPIGVGQGAGLSDYVWGQQGGQEAVALQPEQLPAHSHALKANSGDAEQHDPNHNLFAKSPRAPAYSANKPNTTMDSTAIANTGDGHPHDNLPPYLAIYFIIALQGVFPNRN